MPETLEAAARRLSCQSLYSADDLLSVLRGIVTLRPLHQEDWAIRTLETWLPYAIDPRMVLYACAGWESGRRLAWRREGPRARSAYRRRQLARRRRNRR